MASNFDQYWQKIRDGDEKAFETLFNELYASLCFYSKRITRDKALSEEIVSDVFHKIWQSRDILFIRSSFKSYLFQSVHNFSINELKKKNIRKFAVHATVPEETWKYILDHKESDDFIIEKITSPEIARVIERAVENLSPQCRKVFQFSRFEHQSAEEIAVQLQISVNTVRAHIYHALQVILESLRKDY